MKTLTSTSFGIQGNLIPRSRVGIQTNQAAAATGFVRGAVRTWDCRGGTANAALVKNFNPSDGVYDWTSIDGILAGSPGATIHVCLGCPPDWMVSRAAIGGAAYGGKSNMVPDNLDAYCAVVVLLAQRIKAAGSVAVWDTWNEINGAKFYAESGYTLLGPYVKAVAAAIRSVQPDAVINAPNTNQDFALLTSTLAVSDGAGGSIWQHCNGASWHYYFDRRTVPEVAMAIAGKNAQIRAAVPAGWSISVNEAGIESANPRAAIIHVTRMAVCAALEVDYMAYSADHVTYGMSGQEATWNAIAEMLIDSKLVACYLDHGQSLVLETTVGRATIRASGVTLG